jgi:hypothetical protein
LKLASASDETGYVKASVLNIELNRSGTRSNKIILLQAALNEPVFAEWSDSQAYWLRKLLREAISLNAVELRPRLQQVYAELCSDRRREWLITGEVNTALDRLQSTKED